MNISIKTFYLLPIVLLMVFAVQAQETDSSKKRAHLFAATIISRSIETNWSFGAGGSFTFYTARKKDSSTRTSSINFLGTYSLRKQFFFTINGPVFFPGEHYILESRLSYSSYPDRFWGLGNNTSNSQEEPYSFSQYYIYLHGKRLLGRRLFAGISYEFQRVIELEKVDGGLFDIQNIPGRNPYQVSGLGFSFAWDKRNNAFWPVKGHLFSLIFTHFSPIILSDHRYNNIIADMRLFSKISKQHIVALQAYGMLNMGDDVPIRSLASLGGADKMRGYFNGRYRDQHLMNLQAEYRMHLFRRFSAVGFCGIGDVAGKNSTLSFNKLKYSFGGGLRFAIRRNEKQHIRLDYGFGRGKENRGFYLQFGEAF
jgi:outer membrane protein assembly factor BamA